MKYLSFSVLSIFTHPKTGLSQDDLACVKCVPRESRAKFMLTVGNFLSVLDTGISKSFYLFYFNYCY